MVRRVSTREVTVLWLLRRSGATSQDFLGTAKNLVAYVISSRICLVVYVKPPEGVAR